MSSHIEPFPDEFDGLAKLADGGRVFVSARISHVHDPFGDAVLKLSFLFYLGEKILESKKDYQTFVDENKIEIENFLNYFK